MNQAAQWLLSAHLPYEGGVMYMPGRGAEVRCTQWAAAALTRAGTPGLDAERLVAWLRRIQNADGGFGYWHGRASDMVATAAGVETLLILGRDVGSLDTPGLAAFVASCRADDGYSHTPGGRVTAAATAQALRIRMAIGGESAEADASLLDRFASPLGGYAATPRDIPDLLSTYQVILTRQGMNLGIDDDSGLERFLAKVRRGDGYAWSPLGERSGGSLAAALGACLDSGATLPRLVV
jgi:prenyltransferase beta subunit